MAQLNFDASQVSPDMGVDVVPAGWYNAMIDESDMKPTKDGTGAYLQTRFSIVDGQYQGRKVFMRLNLRNSNPTAQEIAYKQLSAIAHAVGVIQVQDSSQLHGIPMKVKVKVRKDTTGQYEDQNEITVIKNINEPVDMGAGAPAAGGVPAGFGGAPNGGVPAGFGQPQAAPVQQPQQYQPQQQPQQQQWAPQPQAGAAAQPWQNAAPVPAAAAPQQPVQQAPEQQAWAQPQGQQPWAAQQQQAPVQQQMQQPPMQQQPVQQQAAPVQQQPHPAQGMVPPWQQQPAQ